jgi:hypothetical protein
MPRRAHGEDGVTLLLALAFLSLFALVIPAMLQLGGTNLLDTSRLHEQRSAAYAADGATEAAVQYLRDHPDCGRLGLTCPTSSVTWTSNSTTATAAFVYGGGILDFDRTFNITTSIGGNTRLTATVIVRDSQQLGNVEPPVDVKSWTYVR